MTLKVLDLFSGIGGFSLGLERTGGFKTVAHCEIDPYARSVLAKHWPDTECLPDVQTAEFPNAHVITAGFPCQDISYAGDGAGLAGARSGLYRHVIRAIRLVRPQYAILENVAALLSRGLDTVLGDLAEIGNDAEWHCIPASAVGAPHRRDRIWIIAHPRGKQHEVGRAPFSGTLAKELSKAFADAESDGRVEGAEDAGGRSEGTGAWQEYRPGSGGRWWAAEPDVGRVAHGVPARVDRLKGLGNAVVPQIPEMIGRAILGARP